MLKPHNVLRCMLLSCTLTGALTAKAEGGRYAPLPPLVTGSLEELEQHSIVIAKQSLPKGSDYMVAIVCVPRGPHTPSYAEARFIVGLRDENRQLFSITTDAMSSDIDPSHEKIDFGVREEIFDQLVVVMVYQDSRNPSRSIEQAGFRSTYEFRMGPLLRSIEEEDLYEVSATRCTSSADVIPPDSNRSQK